MVNNTKRNARYWQKIKAVKVMIDLHLPHPAATAILPSNLAPWTGRQIGRTLAEKTAGVWKREQAIVKYQRMLKVTLRISIAKSCVSKSTRTKFACGGAFTSEAGIYQLY